MAIGETRVSAVALSPAKGTPKSPVAHGRLVRERGFDGDAHAGPGPRQVSLLSWPSIRGMEARFGAPLGFGRFGENLVVDDALSGAEPGDLIAIGARAVLEVTAIGKECHTGCAIRQVTGDCIMPREGVFARVLLGGEVSPGDRVRWMKPSTDVSRIELPAISGEPLLGHVVTALRRCETPRLLILPAGTSSLPPDLAAVLAARCEGMGMVRADADLLPACLDRVILTVFEAAIGKGITSLQVAATMAGMKLLEAGVLDELGPAREEKPCGM